VFSVYAIEKTNATGIVRIGEMLYITSVDLWIILERIRINMWFWFAVIALLCWSGSDLFSKIGCQDSADKYSHLKMVMAVGLVMGLHALYEVFFNDVPITWSIIVTYLPVSMLYILSMAIGYLGLRYIELSISSPICNSSGALVAVLTLIFVGIGDDLPPLALVAVGLVCVGVVALGFTEAHEDEELRRARQDASNRHYAKSWIHRHSHRVLPAGRSGHLCRQPGAGRPGRGAGRRVQRGL